MNVIFAASEITPYGSTGGLADVANALPTALQAHDINVARVMPFYTRFVEETGRPVKKTDIELMVSVGMHSLRAEVWQTETDETTTYFIRRDEFFDRSELYGLPHRDYEDNFERFLFFQKAVIDLIDALDYTVDIIHCNDWQTGLVPLLSRFGTRGMGRVADERTVFTIHNLAYQGLFPASKFSLTHLPLSTFTVGGLEFYNQMNFLKAGIIYSDSVTTVSRTYAEEIQTDELGCGLQDALQTSSDRLHGIVNGVDYGTWNPETDPHLKANYHSKDLRGKRSCRRDLAQTMDLDLASDRPLIGMVTRLAEQKGLDILSDAIESIMELDVTIVLLGTGQEKYHLLCEEWAERWPDRFAVRLAYDNALAHQIEGGADLFLMPSRFEPCGLNQLYSLRYGTLPIVTPTGGLKDTIQDVDDPKNGTGFVLSDYSAEALTEAIQRAVNLYQDRPRWLSIMKRAMTQDFSWDHSAAEYVKLYTDCLS